MDYHNPHSDLFQMATEPWCDDYVAQYGNPSQYPVASSFAYNLPYDELNQHTVVSQPQTQTQAHVSHQQQANHLNHQQQQQQQHQSHSHVTPQIAQVTPQAHHNYAIIQQSPLQQNPHTQNSSHMAHSHHVTSSQNQAASTQPPASNYQLYSSVQVPYEDVYLDTSSSSTSDYLLTQPYMEAVTSTTTSPSDYDTPHNASSSSSSVSVASRKQPESRMSQPELFSRMGLSHDPEEARNRENRVLSLLKSRGFKLGEQTWIRDTTPAVRQEIVDFIHASTVQEYGYSKYMIEVVIRRACYHLMQGRLRRIRRARKSKGN